MLLRFYYFSQSKKKLNPNYRHLLFKYTAIAVYKVICSAKLLPFNFKSRLSLIVRVNEVLNRTVVVDSD